MIYRGANDKVTGVLGGVSSASMWKDADVTVQIHEKFAKKREM